MPPLNAPQRALRIGNTSRDQDEPALLSPEQPVPILFIKLIGFALLYFISAKLSVRSYWLPSGLALAFYLLTDRRHWPAITLAMLGGETIYNITSVTWPWWALWSTSLFNISAAFSGAWFYRRVYPGKPTLDSVSRLVALVCLGGIIAQLPCSLVGALFTKLGGSKRDYLTILTGWYLRDILGVLLVTPFIIAWGTPSNHPFTTWKAQRKQEAALLMLGVFLIIGLGFVVDETRFGVLRLAAIPLLLWAGMRFSECCGLRGSTTVTLFFSLAWGWMMMRGYFLGSTDPRIISVRNLDMQCTMASMAFIGLVPAIIMQRQRRAEEMLLEERNFLQTTLDHEPESVLVLDLECRPIQINRAGLNLLKLSDFSDLGTSDIASLVHPSHRDRYSANFRLASSGESQSLEFLLEDRMGGTHLIDSKSVPLRSGEDHIYAVLSVWRNVTEERRIENELKVARFTVDRAAIPLFWVRSDGRLVDTNDSACQLVGYSREELLQMHSSDLDADFSADRWPHFWQEVKHQRFADFETLIRHKKGLLISAEVRTHYIDFEIGNQRRELMCVFLHDVTDEKRAAEILQRSEQRLSLIFRTVAEGIVVYDGGGAIIEANPAACRIFGIGPNEWATHSEAAPRWRISYEDNRPPDDEVDPIRSTIRTGKPAGGLLRALLRGDGSKCILSISTEPLLGDDGNVQMIISSFADITAQRSLQDQLRQSQKMEIFGQLAGGIAHDFNNILTAMGMNLYLLESTEGYPPSAKNLLGDLQRMTKRAGGLTEQLLLFARRKVVQMGRVDLNANIKALLKILSPALGEKISLNTNFHPHEIWLEGDSGMFDQIVMNLCVNARDAIPVSGGVITLSTGLSVFGENTSINTRIGKPSPGQFAYLRVADTGTGMTPEVLDRIFEPFFTTKETGKGTGLGLATVHGIVEQHRGFATVDSVAGKGTVFTIFFPLSDSPVSIQRPATKPRCGGETILFVEDEFSVRKLCSMMLRQTGFRVIEAGNAREALTHWKELGNTIDLVVTDMVMPGGLSGSDLITKLRESRPEVKVILTTGYNEEILKADDLTEARVKLITKPYDIESLLRAIAEKLQENLSPAGRS